jgi:hypothetical protein
VLGVEQVPSLLRYPEQEPEPNSAMTLEEVAGVMFVEVENAASGVPLE